MQVLSAVIFAQLRILFTFYKYLKLLNETNKKIRENKIWSKCLVHFAVLVGYMYHSLQLFREQKVLKRVTVGKKIVKKCNFRKDSDANIKIFGIFLGEQP